MINNPDYLLSLCIPTYNRADVLDRTLAVLFALPDFDPERIEVVVSDNCSTDHTPEIVAKYPLVRYFRNDENVRDTNFSLALLRGQGAYVKLMNDTVHMCPGGLTWMLDAIAESIGSGEPIFFYQRGHRRIKRFRTLGEFVRFASFRTTWIGNFGVWRRDLEFVRDVSATASQLLQVDWTYRIAAAKPVKVYCAHYCDVAAVPAVSKYPYPVFRVFIVNFLSLGRNYLGTGHMSRWQFECSKHTLFNQYVRPRAVWLLFGKTDITHFDNRDSWKIIFGNYEWYPYFYVEMLWGILKYLLKGCR